MKKETRFNHLNLFSMRYMDRKGREKSWIFASRLDEPSALNGRAAVPDAVVVVPFHREKNKLVLIREFRVVLGDYQYGFPAGLVDRGEDIICAATRELKEETGLTLVKTFKNSPPVYSSSGMTDESVSMVYVECQGEPSTTGNEDSEEIEVLMVSQKEARDLIEDPGLKFDVKAWVVLSIFAELGRI